MEVYEKHGDVFALYRLPGSYGCLIFNKLYPAGSEVSVPSQEEVMCILGKIRICGANTQKSGSDHEHMNKLITWYSRRLTGSNLSDAAIQDAEIALHFQTL